MLYRETSVLLNELADAVAEGTRKEYMETVSRVPLLILDDFGMRKLPHTAAEDSAGNRHAPLRALQYVAHFKPPRRRTGANCWAISPPSPSCLTDSSITAMGLSAGREAGAPKPLLLASEGIPNLASISESLFCRILAVRDPARDPYFGINPAMGRYCRSHC